jgi:hypothetical protein
MSSVGNGYSGTYCYQEPSGSFTYTLFRSGAVTPIDLHYVSGYELEITGLITKTYFVSLADIHLELGINKKNSNYWVDSETVFNTNNIQNYIKEKITEYNFKNLNF